MKFKNIVRKIKTNGILIYIKILYRKINKKILAKPIEKISRFIFKKFPIRNTIVMQSLNDFDNNAGAFYDYLMRNSYDKKYKFVWLLWNDRPKNLKSKIVTCKIKIASFKKYYYLYTSKYIITDHLVIDKIRRDQTVIYLSHGGISIKKPKGNIKLPKSLDYYLVSSEFTAPICADIYELEFPNNQYIITGYPSHDVFFDGKEGDLSKLTKNKYNKVIVWMPTFRGNSAKRMDVIHDYPLGVPVFNSFEEWNELNDFLSNNNALLIVKIHPKQDLSNLRVKNMTNILIVDGKMVKDLNVDVYKLMKDSDALISDYSSVACDYLLLNKQLAYTIDDLKDFKMGFIVDDPTELMAGDTIKTFDDFKYFISNVVNEKDEYEEKRVLIRNKLFKYCDGDSSKRLAEFLKL